MKKKMQKKIPEKSSKPYLPGWILLSVFVLSTGWYLLQGNVGLNLLDEGYLWHNIQRTFEGGIPILDFRAYDPGRYYWGALWFHILGPGIMTQRFSLYLIQMAGLFFGLLALSRVLTSKWQLVTMGLFFLLWMTSLTGVIGHSVTMMAVFGAVYLIEKADMRRHFAIGIFIGITACFMRDFAVYFFSGFLALIGYIEFHERSHHLLRKYTFWSMGIFIGFLPIIAMVIFIPGFFHAYLDSVLRIFTPYSPITPMPIPWPWKMSSVAFSFHALLLGIAYIMIWAFYGGSVVFMGISKEKIQAGNHLWVACLFIGIPILYHINGRADFNHYAQGVHPFLIALIAVGVYALKKKKFLIVSVAGTALILLFVLVLSGSQEISMAFRKMNIHTEKEQQLVASKIGNDTLWLDQAQASHITFVREFTKELLKPDENILIGPLEAGMYPILKRPAPIWDAFPIHNETLEEQERSIRDLKLNHVSWAIVQDYPLDGMEKRRFSKTHPILWDYLMKNYERINNQGSASLTYYLHKRSL